MKSLLLQKLYHIHRGSFYALVVSLILFEAGMLALSMVTEAISVDFWMIGGCLCIMLLSLTNGRSNAWEKYRTVMPFTKKQVVRMEYLFLLGSSVIFTIIVSIFPLIEMLKNGSFDGKLLFFGSVSVFSVSLFLFLLGMPVNLRFGEKGFMVFSMIVVLMLGFVGFLFSTWLEEALMKLGEYIMTHDMVVIALCELGIVMALTAVSWLVSLILYPKREVI